LNVQPNFFQHLFFAIKIIVLGRDHDGEIAKKLESLFDLRPAAIVKRFGLKNPIFSETAAYGHMGRQPGKKKVKIGMNGKGRQRTVETFTWEKLDMVKKIQKLFKLA
ncbi:MAG: methionine adenosyltransferase domain-containing protein, partial [Bacteroidota bacterium]